MARIERLSEVGIFTRDMKLAKEFYTRKIGMKARSSIPKMNYLQLGATRGGQDAGLDLWQPVAEWGEAMYQAGLKNVGTVTGIGFSTGNLKKTVEDLSRKGVKIESESEGFARFRDPDGNVSFISEQERPKVRRAGIQKLDWITVVSRNATKANTFFTKGLGMKAKKVRGGEGEGDFTIYRLSPAQTSVMPFTPNREMYDNPADYDADMAHIGEDTSIGIEVNDIRRVHEKLVASGVRVKEGVTKQDWGGTTVRIFDPDDNVYMLFEMD